MGRRKLYDPDAARAALVDVFWRQGYEGSSLSDLEAATGLPKQTLYREFGDKRTMYLAALGAYERDELRAASRILAGFSDPAEAFTTLFDLVIDGIAERADRQGCFLCNAASDRTSIDPIIDGHVSAAMARLHDVFTGPFGNRDDAADQGRFLLAGYVGMRVLSRTGMPPADLRKIAAELVSRI